MSDARKSIRFPLEASVTFFWTSEAGMSRHGAGRSRDISEHGVFVLADDCPPLGSKIGLNISLPEFSDIAQALRVQIEGRVLRIDTGSGMGASGFAVMSEQTLLAENGGKSN